MVLIANPSLPLIGQEPNHPSSSREEHPSTAARERTTKEVTLPSTEAAREILEKRSKRYAGEFEQSNARIQALQNQIDDAGLLDRMVGTRSALVDELAVETKRAQNLLQVNSQIAAVLDKTTPLTPKLYAELLSDTDSYEKQMREVGEHLEHAAENAEQGAHAAIGVAVGATAAVTGGGILALGAAGTAAAAGGATIVGSVAAGAQALTAATAAATFAAGTAAGTGMGLVTHGILEGTEVAYGNKTVAAAAQDAVIGGLKESRSAAISSLSVITGAGVTAQLTRAGFSGLGVAAASGSAGSMTSDVINTSIALATGEQKFDAATIARNLAISGAVGAAGGLIGGTAGGVREATRQVETTLATRLATGAAVTGAEIVATGSVGLGAAKLRAAADGRELSFAEVFGEVGGAVTGAVNGEVSTLMQKRPAVQINGTPPPVLSTDGETVAVAAGAITVPVAAGSHAAHTDTGLIQFPGLMPPAEPGAIGNTPVQLPGHAHIQGPATNGGVVTPTVLQTEMINSAAAAIQLQNPTMSPQAVNDAARLAVLASGGAMTSRGSDATSSSGQSTNVPLALLNTNTNSSPQALPGQQLFAEAPGAGSVSESQISPRHAPADDQTMQAAGRAGGRAGGGARREEIETFQDIVKAMHDAHDPAVREVSGGARRVEIRGISDRGRAAKVADALTRADRPGSTNCLVDISEVYFTKDVETAAISAVGTPPPTGKKVEAAIAPGSKPGVQALFIHPSADISNTIADLAHTGNAYVFSDVPARPAWRQNPDFTGPVGLEPGHRPIEEILYDSRRARSTTIHPIPGSNVEVFGARTPDQVDHIERALSRYQGQRELLTLSEVHLTDELGRTGTGTATSSLDIGREIHAAVDIEADRSGRPARQTVLIRNGVQPENVFKTLAGRERWLAATEDRIVRDPDNYESRTADFSVARPIKAGLEGSAQTQYVADDRNDPAFRDDYEYVTSKIQDGVRQNRGTTNPFTEEEAIREAVDFVADKIKTRNGRNKMEGEAEEEEVMDVVDRSRDRSFRVEDFPGAEAGKRYVYIGAISEAGLATEESRAVYLALILQKLRNDGTLSGRVSVETSQESGRPRLRYTAADGVQIMIQPGRKVGRVEVPVWIADESSHPSELPPASGLESREGIIAMMERMPIVGPLPLAGERPVYTRPGLLTRIGDAVKDWYYRPRR